jgi:hypothetical protein
MRASVVGIGLPPDQIAVLEPIDDVRQGRALVAELPVRRRDRAGAFAVEFREHVRLGLGDPKLLSEPIDGGGRYVSLYRLMVTGGLALGPAIGGALLASSPDAAWWGGALVAAVIGAGFLLAGDRVPDHPLAATASNARGDPTPEAV